MTDDDRRPTEERETLVTAAVRVLLAERNWDPDAIPQDDEHDAKEALALAARAYVQALNAYGTHLWEMDEPETLRTQVAELTRERDWLRAKATRDDRVISVFVDYHTTVHPLPEDVRKKVVAAMDGTDVSEVTD